MRPRLNREDRGRRMGFCRPGCRIVGGSSMFDGMDLVTYREGPDLSWLAKSSRDADVQEQLNRHRSLPERSREIPTFAEYSYAEIGVFTKVRGRTRAQPSAGYFDRSATSWWRLR